MQYFMHVLITVVKYNIAESASAQHVQFHDSPFFNHIYLSSYFESLNSYFESLNSYFESLNSYIHIDLIKTNYFLKSGFSACLPK